jgi:hypothetical protein
MAEITNTLTAWSTWVQVISLYGINIQEMVWDNVSQTFILEDTFWLRKMTTDPHNLVYVNIDFMDDRYPKLDICICIYIYIYLRTDFR